MFANKKFRAAKTIHFKKYKKQYICNCAKAQRKMHSLGIVTAEDALIDFAFALESILAYNFDEDIFTKREILELVKQVLQERFDVNLAEKDGKTNGT